MCRSVAFNEANKIVAIGGYGCKSNSHTFESFIAIHKVGDTADFKLLSTTWIEGLKEGIIAMEFIHLAKIPTIVACDDESIYVFTVNSSTYSLDLVHKAKVHTGIFDSKNRLN